MNLQLKTLQTTIILKRNLLLIFNMLDGLNHISFHN